MNQIKQIFVRISPKWGVWAQIYGSIISSTGYLTNGVVNGWTGGALSQLDDEFVMGPAEIAFTVTSIRIGAILSSILSGSAMDILGRKRLILYTSPVLASGWIVMAMAPSIYVLCVGRFITGFATGFLYTTCQIYNSEITQPSLRGTLGSLTSLFLSIGTFLAYILASFIHWRTSCYIFLVPLAILSLGMLTLPESPYWYMLKKQNNKAIDSLSYFRHSDSQAVEEELKEIASKLNSVGQNIGYGELFKARTRLPLLAALFAQCVQQFSGITLVLVYTSKILESTGALIDIRYATTSIGVSQLVSTTISLILIDKVGRKILLSASSASTGLFTTLLASYFLTKEYGVDWPEWTPVLFVFCIVFCYCLGCRSVPFIVASEVFNTAIRSRANSLCFFFNNALSGLIIQVFPYLRLIIGDYGVFFFFGAMSIISAITTCFFLPETKGKSMEEIQEYFEGKANKKKSKTTDRIGVDNMAMNSNES